MNEYSNTSVLDQAKSKIQLFKTLNNPSFDSQGMLHDLQHPGFMSTPDEYGFTDWVRDAWTDWNIMRNETNYSSELGKYQLDQVKVNELDNAEDYLRLVQYNTDSEDKVEIPEELGEEYSKLAKEYKLTGSIDEQISQIGKHKEELFASQNNALNEAKKYQDNAQDWKDRHDLSDYYEYKKEEGIFNQYELDSYLYKLPGIFGSSSSSMGLQALGMIAGLGAGAVISAMSGGTLTPLVGGLLATGLSATSFGANIAAADRENKAEVFDNMKSRVIEQSLNDGTYKVVIDQARKKLNNDSLTDDEVMDQILTNQVDVKNEAFNKSVKDALTGIEQLYTSDMATVLGTESIQTALNIIPFGALAKLGKLGKLGKAINQVTGKKAKLMDELSEKIDDIKYFGLDEVAKLSSRTKRDFVFDVATRQFMQMSSEMVEESNQYLNAQNYIAGKYDGMQPSYIQALTDSWGGAARSLYSFYAPWDTALSSDKEWLENARSGFVLGFLNIPNLAKLGVDARSTYKQLQGDKFVEDIAVNDIFADKDRLNKNVFYADHSVKGRNEEIYRAFNKAKEIGIEGIDDQMWDDERDRAIQIMNQAQSKQTQKMAEERGFKPGTHDYNIYVGLLDYRRERYKEAEQKYNDIKKEYDALVNNSQALDDASFLVFESDVDDTLENGYNIRNNYIEAAKYNAQKQALEELEDSFTSLQQDAEELHAKFGISYNKTDLQSVRSHLRKMINDMQAKSEDGNVVEVDSSIELPSIQKDLVRLNKQMALSRIDIDRAYSDLKDLVASKEDTKKLNGEIIKGDPKAIERSRRQVNKYKRVQKENQEFEQEIQDNHRQEEGEVEVRPANVNQDEEVQAPVVQQEEPMVKQPVVTEPEVVEEPNTEEQPTVEEQPEITPEQPVQKPEYVEPTAQVEFEYDFESRRKELLAARSESVEIGTEPVSRSKAEKNRDAALRANPAAEKELDYYSQGVTHKYNRDNKYGKAYEDASNALNRAVEQIDTEIGQAMSQFFPENAWKYKNGNRKPFFVRQDIDYLLSTDYGVQSFQNVLETFDDLMQLQGQLEDAISDVDVNSADKLIEQINQAIESLNQALDAYTNQQEQREDTIQRTSTIPSYSESGHKLVNGAMSSEESADFIKYSAEPDFIIGSTVEFEVLKDRINVVFNYKGKKIRTRLSPDSSAIGIMNKIREYQKQVEKDSTLSIVPSGVARTAGRIQHGSEERKLSDVSGHWEAKDEYDITPENTTIGVGTKDGIRRGNTLFRKGNYEAGRSYWMVKVRRPESPNNDRTVPVPLNRVKIGEIPGLAEIIIQCYEQYRNGQFVTKDGIKTPIDPIRLLNFIVYNGTNTIVSDQDTRDTQYVEELKKKQLFWEDGKLTIGNITYDMTTLSSNPEVRQTAIKNLEENFNFRIQDENLYANWGSEELKETNPFYGLKSWFELYQKDKLTILPGVIEFDRKMVGLDKSAPKGISVLGYYVKNGLIKTDFTGMADALIYMKDVDLVKNDEGKTDQQIEQSVTEDPINDQTPVDDIVKFLNKEFGALKVDKKSEQKDQESLHDKARKIVKRLTGLEDVEVIDDVLGVVGTDMYILGRARIDSIQLSTFAPDGTEYHESWHRISNLLMEDKQREKLFTQVRKKYGKNLTDIEVDEILADQFRDFELEIGEQLDYTTKNIFRRIWNFVRALVNLKSLQLAKLYTAINRGEFASIRPTQERINRFRKLYGNQGALYTYRGHEFKTFNNSKTIDNAVDSLIYILFNMPDADNKTVTRITDYTDIDKLSLDKLKIKLATSQSPVFNELFQNFDLIEQLIKQKLKRIQVNLLTKQEDELLNEEGEEDLGKIDMDDFTKASYEIDPFSTAPAEVKFFFTTIPEKNWINGQINVVKDATTGLPRFVDPRIAWNVTLNRLHNVKTIQELQDRVNHYSFTEPLFAGVKTKLDKLIERSKHGTPDEQIQAESTLTKILITIHSNKNSFLTVKADVNTVNGETSHELNIIDNTAENKSRALPSHYSQNMFLPGGILEIDQEKGIHWSENGAQTINNLLAVYNTVYNAVTNNRNLITKKGSYDLHEIKNMRMVKEYFVDMLNAAGITIDYGTLDEMINRPTYQGGTEYDRFARFFVFSTDYFGGVPALMKRFETLRDALKKNPYGLQTININEQDVNITQFYNSSGFVKELAKAFIQFHSNSDNLMEYGAGNNLLYASSQNNFSTDTVDELNTDPNLVEDLMNVPYQSASMLLQQIQNGAKLRAQTFVNFRTNNQGDIGSDYHQITDTEDYLAKMTLILNNRLIFPTIADKKTYHVIEGLQLPNERFQDFTHETGIGRRFTFGNQTVLQMLKYAYSELASIQHCMNQLTPGHPDFLPEDQRIKNYHTPNKYKIGKEIFTVEPNGTRFQFLSGVYTYDENGNGIFHNFNDPKKSSADNLKEAQTYFFNQPQEQQIKLINDLLSRRVSKELEYCINKGIIDIKGAGQFSNKLLDDRIIKNRAAHYNRLGYKDGNHMAIMDMIAQYVANTIISVNEVERVFSGNPAFYKWIYDENGIVDASVDKIKRLGSLTSTGINNRLDFEDFDSDYVCAELKDFEIGSRQFTDTLVPMFVDSSIREVVKQVHGIKATLKEDGSNKSIEELKEEFPQEANLATVRAKKEVAGYGDGINVADAAVYVTPEFYAKMMRSIGMWSPEIKEAYRILTEPANEEERNWESQAQAYEKIMKASFKPLKYMAFGRRMENGLAVPYFNKMALFPLFESVATGDIRKLYDRMTDKNNKIDMVLFESAVKAGSKNPLSWKRSRTDEEVYDELGYNQTAIDPNLLEEPRYVNDLYKLTTYKQNMKYLRQQLATDPHTHEEQMAGTQMLKVALANLDLLGNYGFGENKTKGEVIRDTIFSAMNELSDRGRAKLEKRLLGEDGKISQEKLSKFLMDDLETQDTDNNILDGVTYDPSTGRMNLSLSAISNNGWLESRTISLINKEVIDVNLPGGAFIQRSAFGLAADQADVISDKMLNNGKPLKTIDEKDGSLQSIVSINLFKHFIPNYDKMTFTEARKWLIDNNVIGENSEPSAIGYRIPTQAQASIQALKFMDVLPEIMGDTIVLPEDFTKQTGSDFDIDKLYVSRYQFNSKGQKVQFDESKGMEGNSEAAIKNKLVEQYIKVLTTTEYTNQLKVSIDNATATVKGVLEQIESKKKVEHQEPMWVYTPQYQEMVKDEYTKGKSGIGPFALNNAHHILTQLMQIQYVSNDFTIALNLTDLGKQYDDDGSGKRILDWLSAMINAFVDIAKDPYIVRLNVNPYTFNMTAYLLRMGKGEQTFYFLKQPVIDEVAKAVLNTRGNYGKDTTKTQSEIEQEATNKVLEKYGITQDVLDAQRDILKDPRQLATHLEGLFDGELKNMLLSNDITDEQRKKYQAKVWLAWQALTPYAKDMADIVKYSKIDTKKMGKSFAAQRIFEKGMNDMRNPLNNRFAPGEVSRFFDNTFLSKKAQNSINFGRSLFENQLLRTSPKFLDCLDNILYRLGKKNSVDERLLRTIVSSMEAAIKSEFFNQKMIENKVDVYDLMYGENSIAKRLMKLRNRINRNQIAGLSMTSNGFNNELLNFLMPNNLKFETTFQEPDYVNVKTMFDQDVHTKNMIISAWEELLDYSNVDSEVSKLAEDLIYYAFVTSGDNKNMNSFFEFVPTSWRNEYSEFLQNKLDNNETVVDYRDVMLNNWTNNDIVPRIEHTYVEQKITADGIMNEETSLFGIRSKMKAVGSSINPYLFFSGKAGNKNRIKPIGTKVIEEYNVFTGQLQKNRYPIYPSFVKIKYGSTNSPSSYIVYELVGYNREVSKTTQQPVYTPIYMLVNKKGMRYKGHVITEYGRTDNYSFNFFPSGITKQDFTNNVIKDVIQKSPRIPERAKGSFNYTFVSQFEDINTLPSYMSDNEIDQANELEMKDIFGDYGEKVELNDKMEKEGEQIKKQCKGE